MGSWLVLPALRAATASEQVFWGDSLLERGSPREVTGTSHHDGLEEGSIKPLYCIQRSSTNLVLGKTRKDSHFISSGDTGSFEG